MTVLIAVRCSHCHSTEVVKYGQSANGKQRFRCLNSECPRLTFSLDLAYPGLKPQVKQQIIEMTLNSSGIRNIARVLHVSPATVINELKKETQLESVNRALLNQLQPDQVEVVIAQVEAEEELRVEEAELDEMWSNAQQ